MSAPASFPEGPKWILMNLPWNTTPRLQLGPGTEMSSICEQGEVTYEAGRVVISHGLSVTEGFKYRVSLDDLVLQSSFLLLSGGLFLFGARAYGGEVRDYLLRVLCLSCSGLASVGREKRFRSQSENTAHLEETNCGLSYLRDQHRLVFAVCGKKEKKRRRLETAEKQRVAE